MTDVYAQEIDATTNLEPADGPPQYRGSGWSGARSGQDPSEVLGGPAAGSGEIRRGQPKSGQFWL